MIIVIETIMAGLTHEIFNAGMLYQLRIAYPNEKIIYFCEENQGKFVKRILDTQGCTNNIQYSYINRTYMECNKENIRCNKNEYINIFKEWKHIKFVIVLSMQAINSGLLKNLIRRFSTLKFAICIHGNIENILPQNKPQFKMNNKLIKEIKDYRQAKWELEYFIKNLNDMTLFPNCNIILYSDNYKKYKEYLSTNLYENIKVLNLPYVFKKDKKLPSFNKKLRIGIMPLTSTEKSQNAIKIIKYINKEKDRVVNPYSFLIFNYYIGTYKNAIYIKKPNRTRKDIEEFLEMCDWILIPYDNKKYILSSSGILFDSIEAERPFFVLGSPSFYKAIKAGCGIQENSIEELGERIIQQINNKNLDYKWYYNNIKNYKKRVEKENIEGIIKILGE